MKKSMRMMYLAAMNMMVLQAMLMAKLTMKKLIQQHRIYRPFIFIIYNCRYSFQDTSMYSRRGSSRDRPSGQRPDPITFTILLMKLLSSPEKGMYIIDPEMTSFGWESMRKGRVMRYTKESSPSVTLKYVLIVVVSEVFTTIFVTPLFLWYSGSLKSLIANPALKVLLFICLNLMIPSGMSVLRSSPRSKFNLLAFQRQLMTYAFADSTFTIFGESDPSGHSSLICIAANYSPISAEGDRSQKYNCWQLSPSCGLRRESAKGKLRGCGQSMDQTAPVVIPPTICLTARVKSRQRTGLIAWQIFEQIFLDWRVMLFLNRALTVAEVDPFLILLEESDYNSSALLVICSCCQSSSPLSCSLSIL